MFHPQTLILRLAEAVVSLILSLSPTVTVANMYSLSDKPTIRLFRCQALRPSLAGGTAVVPRSAAILVAGGESRHCTFGAAGSRISSVERYDVEWDQWVEMEHLPGLRAECLWFVMDERMESWVIGRYCEKRTIREVLPTDDYCTDAVVVDLRSRGDSGRWWEV